MGEEKPSPHKLLSKPGPAVQPFMKASLCCMNAQRDLHPTCTPHQPSRAFLGSLRQLGKTCKMWATQLEPGFVVDLEKSQRL